MKAVPDSEDEGASKFVSNKCGNCDVHPEDSGGDIDNLKLEMISYFII